MNEPATQNLAKLATNSVFGIGGGIALCAAGFVLKWLVQPAGLALGGVIVLLGLTGVFSGNSTDRKDGLMVTLTGGVLLCFFLGIGPVKNIAGTLLSVGSIISFAVGIWNGIRFLAGLNKRR
ncbi:MAG: hypothetical protein LBD22_02330 [Spirochaetaceae bacterium]|jgi:hypothetical protein|nr:hypothetical protein [Spirochaetaceae bacterium]